jgi:hypothetical protein
MITILGNNDSIPNSKSETITIPIEMAYFNQKETTLKLVKDKFVNKVVRNIFVDDVIEVLEFSPWILNNSDTGNSLICYVVFKCKGFRPCENDIIVGAECLKSGKGKDGILLRKNNMIIRAKPSINISTILEGQFITIKIKDITWSSFSNNIPIIGTMEHARVRGVNVFKLAPNRVKKYASLIKDLNQLTSELSTLNSKMKTLHYPFSKDQSKKRDLKIEKFSDILDSMISGKTTEPVIVISCCFLPQEDGVVYVAKKDTPYTSDTSYNVLMYLYETQKKNINNVSDMLTYYSKMPTHIVNFYKTSKLNNDILINNVAASLN